MDTPFRSIVSGKQLGWRQTASGPPYLLEQLRTWRVLQPPESVLQSNTRTTGPNDRACAQCPQQPNWRPNSTSARTEFQNLQQNERESIKEFPRRVRKLGEAANAHLKAAGRQESNKHAFIDGLLESEIWYALLKEDQDTFIASAQRAIAFEAIAKVENARYRPRRTGHVRRTQGDHDENGRKTKSEIYWRMCAWACDSMTRWNIRSRVSTNCWVGSDTFSGAQDWYWRRSPN